MFSWKSRLNVCSSSSGEGSERNVEPWPPCGWLSPVEPKWPLTQSPLLESTATLDLQEKFSFEDLSSWLPSSPARSPSPAVPLRVVPTLSTTDMKTAGENRADSTAASWHHGVKWEFLKEVGLDSWPDTKQQCYLEGGDVKNYGTVQVSLLSFVLKSFSETDQLLFLVKESKIVLELSVECVARPIASQ